MELNHHDLTLKYETCQLYNNITNDSIFITDAERKFLKLLLEHQLVSETAIKAETSWNSIPASISRLRNKFERLNINTKIVNINKVGYRLD